MPPRRYSRYTFATASKDEEGTLMLQGEGRFSYRALEDTREHVVGEGDTLWSLAARYFASLPLPATLYWIIADFQPDPIHDPTITLTPGRVLYVPSLRTVTEEVFSERRRKE